MNITIEKVWDGNEGVTESRNGREYVSQGRWQWLVAGDGIESARFDLKREAVRYREQHLLPLVHIRVALAPKGGNNFYRDKSERQAATLCGAPATDKDVDIRTASRGIYWLDDRRPCLACREALARDDAKGGR
jgi:hypothetical protein